jgi:hypothetical protein
MPRNELYAKALQAYLKKHKYTHILHQSVAHLGTTLWCGFRRRNAPLKPAK